MKTILATFLLALTPLAANPQLNELIEKRIQANKKLTEEILNELDGEELKYSKQIHAHEKKLGAAWDEFLKHVKNSKDPKLKVLVMNIELNQALIDAFYEAEGLNLLEGTNKIMQAKKDLETLEEAKKELAQKGAGNKAKVDPEVKK